jgi:outer membrane usher protein FimD/PapC
MIPRLYSKIRSSNLTSTIAVGVFMFIVSSLFVFQVQANDSRIAVINHEIQKTDKFKELKVEARDYFCPKNWFTWRKGRNFLCPGDGVNENVNSQPKESKQEVKVNSPIHRINQNKVHAKPQSRRPLKKVETLIVVNSEKKPAVNNSSAKIQLISNQAAQALFGAPVVYADAKATDIPIPIYLNLRNIGTELVKLNHGEKIEVDRMYVEMLVSDLEKLMEKEKFFEFKERTTGLNMITKEELDGLGIKVTYRIEDSSINMEMPNEWLKPFALSFNGFDYGSMSPNTYTAPFSGYVNTHVTAQSTSDINNNSDAIGVTMDAELTVKGVSFITGGNYYNRNYQRTETAFVFPWNFGQNQIWVGDAKYSNSSSVSYPELSGFNYFKKGIATDSHSELDAGLITVKNKSSVQIYKNESIFRTITVGPGNFHLSDLPLDLGQNTIRIVIKDLTTGEITEKVIEDFLPIYSVPEKQWEQVFSYGYHRTNGTEGIQYFGEPASFLGLMYGLNRQINVGTNIYNSGSYIRTAEEVRQFSAKGNISASINQSKSETNIIGPSVKLQYSKQEVAIPGIKSVSVSGEISGGGYARDANQVNLDAAKTATVNLSLRPINKFNFNLGDTLTETSDNLANTFFISAGRNYSINRNWAFGMGGGKSWSNRDGEDVRFSLSLSYQDKIELGSVSAIAEQTQDRERLSSSFRAKDDLSITAQANKPNPANVKDSSSSLNLQKSYQRANVTAGVSNADHIQAGYIEVGTAIAFTNEAIAVSKPIGNSFIIFESLNPRGVEFDVNDSSSNILASGGESLRAVVVPIRDYTEGIFSAGFSDPEYYTLESSKSTIYLSGFRTGATVFLSSDQRSIISGKLVDSKDQIIKQVMLNIECAKEDDLLLKSTFTNIFGEFQFSVKRNADCHVKVGDKKSESLDLTWPVKYRDIGQIQIK